jgi:S1-C subfamily serine protease
MFFSHWWLRLTKTRLYKRAATTTLAVSVRYKGTKRGKNCRASAFALGNGVVCTARHVAENAQWLWLTPKGGGLIEVDLKNVHIVPEADIAFIVVPELQGPAVIPAANVASDTELLMLRTPFGLTTVFRAEEPLWGNTRYTGVHVRDFSYMQDWMFTQHDNMFVTNHLSIPGDSGSALFNAEGNVVGMVIQRVTEARLKGRQADDWQHMTFAIPIEDILAHAQKLNLI